MKGRGGESDSGGGGGGGSNGKGLGRERNGERGIEGGIVQRRAVRRCSWRIR